jgi:hypothetical protein
MVTEHHLCDEAAPYTAFGSAPDGHWVTRSCSPPVDFSLLTVNVRWALRSWGWGAYSIFVLRTKRVQGCFVLRSVDMA